LAFRPAVFGGNLPADATPAASIQVTPVARRPNKPNLTVNGATIDAPKALVSWEGYA
jgi:hypothetical protein